jgi:DMSO/TMAO reductase YedYZ molybdopterin-dependent catalytic subunit
MENEHMGKAKPEIPLTPEQQLARRSRRSFLVLGAGAAGAIGAWEWLTSRPLDNEIQAPLRKVLDVEGNIAARTVFGESHLAATYPESAIGKLKVNGDIGMEKPIDLASWCLELTPLSGQPRQITMTDIRSLPRHEEIIDFKCVEGWSVVTQFAGARLADFTARFAPGSENAAWVGMSTPGDGYYVGIDMASALHPQTLLAYQMNGNDLEPSHGAPLRLMSPVKYGIKNIKRIGSIEYTNKRPADYWFEQGYDYYSGL